MGCKPDRKPVLLWIGAADAWIAGKCYELTQVEFSGCRVFRGLHGIVMDSPFKAGA